MLKKCILLIAAFVISCLVGITPASAILIDFETYPDGTLTSHLDQVNTQFSSWGISQIWSEDDYGNMVDAVIRQDANLGLYYASGGSALAPWVGDDTYYGGAQAPIAVSFATPIYYFSVYAMDVGWNGLKAEAYGTDASLISSVSIDGTGRGHDGPVGQPDWLDFIEFSFPGISEIRFSQIHDPNWDVANNLGLEGYLLDDVTFDPVPEPATILLMTSGLVGLVGFRRKLRN